MGPSGPAAGGKRSALASQANEILVEDLGLTFPNGFVGLKSTRLHVPQGCFCTLLGPSGSGKTTLLRAIAGLATPTSGRILIGSRDVTHLPVQARNIGFVFQNYALFPHMTVAENLDYPLKIHGWNPGDRVTRVREILDLIELPHVRDRAVGELSGGQQQRVAIGRALAYRPSLLLLDEPMGALDRRLRQQLGADLREVQQRTGITAVYVTHDQEEAYILSDAIAIMRQGEIVQYSTPLDLYSRPRNRFVAEFLGEANFIPVDRLHARADGGWDAMTPYGPLVAVGAQAPGTDGGTPCVVVRPEDVRIAGDAAPGPDYVDPVPVEIERVLFLGSRCLVTTRAGDGRTLLAECPRRDLPPPGAPARVTWRHADCVLVHD